MKTPEGVQPNDYYALGCCNHGETAGAATMPLQCGQRSLAASLTFSLALDDISNRLLLSLPLSSKSLNNSKTRGKLTRLGNAAPQ
jgi:hypothetical protein